MKRAISLTRFILLLFVCVYFLTVWQHPYVNVLKLHQKNDLKFKTQGDVKQYIDNIIGKQVFQISGAIPAANYISLPDNIGRGSNDQKLSLTGHLVYIELKINPNEYYVFHIEILTKDDYSLRISFSNIYKDFKKTLKTLFFTAPFLTNKWTVLALDLKSIVAEHFGKVFKSIRGFMFCANMLFRNVFTSPNIYQPNTLPRDMFLPFPKDTNWFDLYDWHWFPSPPDKIELEQIIAPETLPKPYESSTPRSLYRKKRIPRDTSVDSSTILSDEGASTVMYPNPIMKCHRVMGYNGAYSSNVLWTMDGKHILYPCDSTIIKMNVETGEQAFFLGHTEDVCTIAIDSKSQTLASAQAGKTALIRVWNIETNRCTAILKAHEQDVCSLAISDNGNMLAGVGRDRHVKQLIVLWDLSKTSETGQAPIVTKYTCDYSIHSIKFVPLQESNLVTCGEQSIRFWRVKNGALRGCSLANENYDLTKQSFIGMGFEKNFIGVLQQDQHRLFVSTASGSVYEINYEERIVECIYQLHNGPINSLFINEGMCVTASDDKYIRVWPLDFHDYFLEAEHDSSVRSVGVSQDGLRIAVGTASGSIGVLNLTTQKHQTLIRSHTMPIKDVATDPQRNEFSTISNDETIRVWDLTTFKQLYQFDTAGDVPSSITYHPYDYVIACGFSSGVIRVFDIAAASVIEEYRAHARRIQDICYSRDCRWLISICEESICISDALHRYQPVKLISFAHPCLKACLSLSADGKYLASIGPSGNIVHLFNTMNFDESHTFETATTDTFCAVQFSPDSKELIAVTSDARLVRINVERGDISTEVPNIHSSMVNTLEVPANGKYMVTAGNDRIVKIWDSQAQVSTAQAFIGHSKNINKVAFSYDMKYLISVGDDCVIVWSFSGDTTPDLSLLIDNHIEKLAMEQSQENDDTMPVTTFENMLENAIFPKQYQAELPVEDSVVEASTSEATPINIQNLLKRFEPNHISTPVSLERLVAPLNEEGLSLHQVLGYNGNAHDNVIWESKHGKLYYSVGSNVIIDDLETGTQKQLFGHTEDISCMTFCQDRRLLASASGVKEVKRSPIIIWDCERDEELIRLEFHTNGVQSIRFSPNGQYLASVGLDDNSLIVSSVIDGAIICSVKAPSKTHAVEWIPNGQNNELVTVGEDSVIFWLLNDNNELLMQEPEIDKSLVRSNLEHVVVNYTCIEFHPDCKSVWIGSDQGFIIALNLETASLQQIWLDIHSGEIDEISWCGEYIITSGSDQTIKRWKSFKTETDLYPVFSFEHREQMDLDGPVVAMQLSPNGSEGIVATAANTIWYINWAQKQCIRLVSGHLAALNSLAAASGIVVSTSTDRTIRFWSHKDSKFEQILQVQTATDVSEPTCCLKSSYGTCKYCVVGYSDGSLHIIRTDALDRSTRHLFKKKIKLYSEPVVCMVICGNHLLCASATGTVTLINFDLKHAPFEQEADYSLHTLVQQPGYRICSIDAIQTNTRENRFVISNTAGEVSIWRVNKKMESILIHKFTPPEFSLAVAEREKFLVDVLVKFCPTDITSIVYTGPFCDEIGPAIIFYNYKRKQMTRSFTLQRFVRCMDISDTSDYFAFGTGDRLVVLMDYENGTIQEYQAHGDSVSCIQFYTVERVRWLLSGGFADVCVWKVNL